MGTNLIGMLFFETFSVNLDIKNHLVHFPNHMMSMQVRQQTNKKFKTGLIDLFSSSRTIIPPHHQVLIEVHSDADNHVQLVRLKGLQRSCARRVSWCLQQWLT